MLRQSVGMEPAARLRTGERLRDLREEAGLSLDELAQLAGMKGGRGGVSKWETGMVTPPVDVLLFLADFYGVSMDWLLGREGAERDSPAVKDGKRQLHDRLSGTEGVRGLSPTERLGLVFRLTQEVCPGAFPVVRLALLTGCTREVFVELVEGRKDANETHLAGFGGAVGLPLNWFLGARSR